MFFIGLFIGVVITLIVMFTIRQRLRKKPRPDSVNPMTKKIKDQLRYIIWNYGVIEGNKDFLLEIKINDMIVMQIMHRAYFPELLESLDDTKFGLVAFISLKNFSHEQKIKMAKILADSSEDVQHKEIPFEYKTIEIGTLISHGGYFLGEIISNVFSANEESVSFKIYSDGNLPFVLDKKS